MRCPNPPPKSVGRSETVDAKDALEILAKWAQKLEAKETARKKGKEKAKGCNAKASNGLLPLRCRFPELKSLSLTGRAGEIP